MSESKFLSAPHDFIPHIRSRNTEALAGLITKPQVEAKLLVRLENKANVYGGEMDADGRVVSDRTRINVGAIVDMYREHVIPLTKDVEVGCWSCVANIRSTISYADWTMFRKNR